MASASSRGSSGIGVEPGSEPSDQVDAGGLIRLGLGVADDGLAEQVGREADTSFAEGLDGLERLGGGRAGDEPVGHVRGRDSGDRGQGFPPEGADRRQGHAQLHEPGDELVGLVEILAEVPADRLVGMDQGRKGVDEPEELDLDRGRRPSSGPSSGRPTTPVRTAMAPARPSRTARGRWRRVLASSAGIGGSSRVRRSVSVPSARVVNILGFLRKSRPR